MFLPKSFFSTTTYFGLSISKSSLRAVSLNHQGSIVSYSQFPLVDNVIDGRVTNKPVFIEALKKVVSDGHFSSPYAAVVMSEAYAFSREHIFPKISLEEVPEAISWQTSNIFPFSPEEIYTDWKLLQQNESGITVLVVAVPKKLIDDIRYCMGQAGIFPISFEPSVSSVSRLVTLSDQPVFGIIEVDSKGSTASLVENNVSLLTTTHPLSPSNDSQSLVTAVAESINSLIKFYADKRHLPSDSLQFFLTGELADQNLAKSLATSLNHPVSPLDISGITPAFHQAYAAASTQVLPPKSELSINLIPTDLQDWYHHQHETIMFKQTFKFSLISLGLSLLITGGTFFYQFNTKKSLQNQLVSIAPVTTTPTLPIGPLATKANRIKNLFPLKITPEEDINSIIAAIPEGIFLENLNYDKTKQTYQLIGTASTRDDLIAFKTNLESIDSFQNVNIPLGALADKQNINFSVSFNIVSTKP